MPEWRPWVPGMALSLGCLLTLGINRQHAMPLRMPLDSIPVEIAGRSGEVGIIPEDQQIAAGMSSYLFRWYGGEEAPFEIYVGYYEQQTQGKTIHSPKNCLPGSGWEALSQTTTRVQTRDGPRQVNRYLLQNKEQRALVFYWYQGRGRVAADEYQVKWDLLRDAALRGRTEEALVRIVVHLNERTDETVATDWATRVAGELIPEVSRALPQW